MRQRSWLPVRDRSKDIEDYEITICGTRAGSNEQKFVDELNLARTKPAEYAKFVEKHKKYGRMCTMDFAEGFKDKK